MRDVRQTWSVSVVRSTNATLVRRRASVHARTLNGKLRAHIRKTDLLSAFHQYAGNVIDWGSH